MLFKKNKSVFDKIDEYLTKRGHELVFSIYLCNYNGNNIYIRFDYVRKMSVYKIVWADLNYFNEKNIEDYISNQLVTKFLSTKLVEIIAELSKLESGYEIDENIKGDRVEILTYFGSVSKEFIFDRFLPLEWSFLIDPLALVFSYLPRSMEVFLNEIFGKFDKTEDAYNFLNPCKFDLLNGDCKELFKKTAMDAGEKLYVQGKVKFLEKIDDKYLALVDDKVSQVVMVQIIDDDYVLFWCKCKNYCKHVYAVIKAIREGQFNNFYKVKYVGKNEQSMLEKIMVGSFYLSYGLVDEKMSIVTLDGMSSFADVVQHGKIVFEVIEDDDECTLSEELKKLKQ